MEPFAVDVYHSHWIEDGTCGAACAQMLLRMVPLTTQQAVLYCDQCHTPGLAGWRTTPEGLSATLIAKDPANAPHYQIVTAANAEIMTRHLCWMISSTGTRAPAALVNGKMHWVVVNGFFASRAPQASSDTGYDIERLSIKDPGIPKSAGSTSLDMHIDVPKDEWLKNYLFSPVSSSEKELTAYRNRYVAIGDVIPPNEVRTVFPATPTAPASPVASVVDEEEALGLAHEALSLESYFDGLRWSDLIQVDFEPITPFFRWRDPRFPDDATYFIPFRQQGNSVGCPEIPFVVQIGLHGEYRGLAMVPGGSLYLQDVSIMLDPDAVQQLYANRTFDNPVTGDSFNIGFAVNEWAGELSWTPSSVSLSPFMPYYIIEFQTDDRGIVPVYLRLDGKYFFELDETIAGW